MSASLVGSEMCIRDRGAPARACACTAGLQGLVEHAPNTRQQTPRATRGSVSYTHLTLPTICSV
eukprot:6322921-Alexandrium_andersonii.AAC.1